MTKRRILVISPSGNFYGSEQVLMDHLRATSLQLDIAAPAGSLFIGMLRRELPQHHVIAFDPRGLTGFYLHVARWLLAGRYDTLYFNEAGHGRYAGVLAKAFPGKRFIIHVRIAEDTAAGRSPKNKKNVTLVTISRYMKDMLGEEALLEYDPYPFRPDRQHDDRKVSGSWEVGVIGRITATKGVHDLLALTELAAKQPGDRPRFRLYGEEGPDVKGTDIMERLLATGLVTRMGFVNDKEAIYRDLDVVLHLSRTEPLGRISFEAMDHRLPLVGFHAAGIGEIGDAVGLTRLLVDPQGEDTTTDLLNRLREVREDPERCRAEIEAALPVALKKFGLDRYVRAMDQILCG